MKTILDESKVNRLYRIACDPNDYANKYENILGQKDFNIFYNAPCVVYIVGDRNLKNTKVNCTLAASYFMMSATAKNLATCWINFRIYISRKMKNSIRNTGKL